MTIHTVDKLLDQWTPAVSGSGKVATAPTLGEPDENMHMIFNRMTRELEQAGLPADKIKLANIISRLDILRDMVVQMGSGKNDGTLDLYKSALNKFLSISPGCLEHMTTLTSRDIRQLQRAIEDTETRAKRLLKAQ